MERPSFFLVLVLCAMVANAQVGQWIDLKDAQTDLLGKPISRVNNGSPIFIPDAAIQEITYEVSDGAESANEYKKKFRSFLTGILDLKSYEVKDIQVRKIKYISINPKHFYDGSINVNTRFAYSGQTADTVIIKIRKLKEVDIDFKNLLDTILKKIPINTGGISDVIANLKADIDDSLSTTIKIINPNVFFKARFVEFLNANPPRRRTWDSYWIHFFNNNSGGGPFTILNINGPQVRRETKRRFVQFWGPNDDRNRLYYFKVKRDNNDLKLYFCRFTSYQGELILKEIPSKSDGSRKIWELEFSKVDEFLHRTKNEVTKLIYIACYADQLDENTIRIHNYEGNSSNNGSIITYVKYPEIRFRHLKRNE